MAGFWVWDSVRPKVPDSWNNPRETHLQGPPGAVRPGQGGGKRRAATARPEVSKHTGAGRRERGRVPLPFPAQPRVAHTGPGAGAGQPGGGSPLTQARPPAPFPLTKWQVRSAGDAGLLLGRSPGRGTSCVPPSLPPGSGHRGKETSAGQRGAEPCRGAEGRKKRGKAGGRSPRPALTISRKMTAPE